MIACEMSIIHRNAGVGEDIARLSPFMLAHINVIGKYSFQLPDLGPDGIRQLLDPGYLNHVEPSLT